MTDNRVLSSLANSTAAGKNLVINGGMEIWQRGASIAQASSLTYTADRWGAYRAGYATGTTISRQLTNDTSVLPHIQYCARIQRNSGTSGLQEIVFTNNFETVNSIPLAGKTVTLSFYARKGSDYSSNSSVLSVNFISGTGTDLPITNYTGAAYPIANGVVLTNSWQRFSFTGTLALNITQASVWFSYTPTGTAGANDYFEITGVQLELGPVATPFSRMTGTIQQELAACQRYYTRFSADATYSYLGGWGPAWNGSQVDVLFHLPVQMRTYVSSIDTSGLGCSDNVAAIYTGGTFTLSSTGYSKHTIGVRYTHTSSVFTTYRMYTIYPINNSSGYIGFSAEL